MKNFFNNYKITINFLGIKISIKNKLYAKSLCKKINKDIGKYKYVHVMHNDKFNKSFVDFLNKNFDNNEHMILCQKLFPDEPPRAFPKGNNVYEWATLDNINFNTKNIKKIIFHELRPDYVDFLYQNKELLSKSFWTVWGGDLYWPPRDEKNDFVRSNLKGYLCSIDKEYALNKYHMKGDFYEVHYPFSTVFNKNHKIKKRLKDEPVIIQVGKSGEPSNLEVFDFLAKFKNENIKIRSTLSYCTRSNDDKEKILKKGFEIFGDKFEPLLDFLPPEDYTKYVSQNDILILNSDKQEGVGNVILHLIHGAKIYVKSSISTFKYFNNKNVKIFDAYELNNISFEELIKNEYAQQNIENIKDFTDENCLANLWKKVFTD